MGIFAFVASGGGAVGLLVGGLITQTISWHWIFFVNLPIGLATLVFAARLLESDPGIGIGEGADVLGAVLVTAALMLGIYTIVDVNSLGVVRTVAFSGVSLALLVAFLVRQAIATNPLLPLRILRSRNVAGANIIQALMVAAFFGMFFLGTLYMERVLRYKPLEIGLAFLPDSVAMGVLSYSFSAKMINRFGPRRVVLVGLALVAVSLELFVLVPVHSDYVRNLLLPMALMGVGAGLCFPSLTIIAMSDATSDDSGLASGLLNTTTQIGASLGLAALATLSIARTQQLVGAGKPATDALSDGYHLAWSVGVGLVLLALALALVVLKPDTAAAAENWKEETQAIA
jgi:MFS family permease